jgi:acyl carrier protein
MDWLNVIVGLHERFGVDIPESDYAKLTTLDVIVAYLAGRIGDAAGGAS